MDDSSSSSQASLFPFQAGHLWVVSLIIGVVTYVTARNVPLESERPQVGQEAYLEPKPPFDPRVPATHARLWEDPLLIAYSSARTEKPGNPPVLDLGRLQTPWQVVKSLLHCETPLQEAFCALLKKHSPLAVMPVLVPGEPYAEHREFRLRMQYALLTALSNSGYELELPTRMGYVHAPINTKLAVLGEELPIDLVVPVKLFRPTDKNSPKRSVLVLWINESQLGDKPLRAISQILDDLFPRPKQKSLGLAIVGPSSSDMLNTMIHEEQTVNHTMGSDRFANWPGPESEPAIYSPLATMSTTDPEREKPKSSLNCGLKLVRTVGDDDQLAKSLLDELTLRGKGPSAPEQHSNQHMVLVYERDTLYGRKLRDSLRASLNLRKSSDANLHVYTYLRGIDGMLPGDTVKDKPTPKDTERTETSGSPEEHLPEGRGQSDYLVRMRQQIEELRRSGNDITAIGVVGSDFYDKLMILRELRGNFTEATFFTTELDSGYSHPKEYQHTRNLIVASHFGLELNHDLQGDAPAFRDSNQTAIFFAVLKATGFKKLQGNEVGDDPWGIATSSDPKLAPLLFEIGCKGPVRLKTKADAMASAQSLIAKIQPLEWGAIRAYIAWTVIPAVIAILLLAICVAFYKPDILKLPIFFLDVRKVFIPGTWQAPRESGLAGAIAAFLILVVTAAVFVSALYANWSANQEHVALGDGISTWPSTFIRYGTLLFCVAALIYYCRKLDDNLLILRKELFGEERIPETANKVLRWFWGDWPIVDLLRSASDEADENSVGTVFERYASVEVWWRRVWRILVPTVLYIVFAVLLFSASGTSASMPFRGPISSAAGLIILLLSALAMAAVLFLVLDAAHFCRRFIRRLSDAKGDWPACDMNRSAKTLSNALPNVDLKELLIVRAIAARTRVVGRLIYVPCIATLLMFLSRLPVFGNWDYPWPLLLIYSLILLGATYATVMLHRDAEQARTDVLGRLRDRLLGAGGTDERRKAGLRLIIRQIEHEQDGAFAPLSSSPVLNAWAVPVGGMSLIALFERFGSGWF